MKVYIFGFILVAVFMLFVSRAFAETIQACPQADGSVLFTNKKVVNEKCAPVHLPELSTVPSRNAGHLPNVAPHVSNPYRDKEIPKEVELLIEGDQSMKFDPKGPQTVRDQVCDLYGKYLDLSLKTRGGLYYSDKTAPLLSLFGGGYIPLDCD